ncbi:MAG: dihydrofolate reductase [Cytophagales bacterium]|nr:MAG: dihydrofolate reductase [Cytophagales bacterium]TAF61332.1 MAG: dihydrofolate reductase [Cytophagales bacterium]
MRKLILYTAVSLDGFISDANNGVGWITNSTDYGFDTFKQQIDTAMMGRHTYEMMSENPQILDASLQQIVFTAGREPEYEQPRVSFMAADHAVGYTRALKIQEGKNIWLIGGGRLNALMLESGLIDELTLLIYPICLGDGIRLFEGSNFSSHFNLKNCQAYDNGLVKMSYTFSENPKHSGIINKV